MEDEKVVKALDWSKLFDKKVAKSLEEIKITQGIVGLNKDASKREKNIIVVGIPNCTEKDVELRENYDRDNVIELFEELGINPEKIKKIQRFKSNDSTSTLVNTPILIELPDSSDKFTILKAAKVLKDSKKFQKVYINPDQTESERKLTKSLVIERKKLNDDLKSKGTLNMPFRYGIRNNEVVMFKAKVI